MDEIKLDRETFKALASETRVAILKLLQTRKYTQSEIAEELGMAVPTVKDHLAALEQAGLVVKHEEGRKWKYFGLTKKTKAIFEPEQAKIWIVLAALVFSVIGGIVTAVKVFFKAEAAKFRAIAAEEAEMVAMEAVKAAPEAVPAAAPAAPEMAIHPALLVFGIASIALAIVLVALIIRSRVHKARLAKILEKK